MSIKIKQKCREKWVPLTLHTNNAIDFESDCPRKRKKKKRIELKPSSDKKGAAQPAK